MERLIIDTDPGVDDAHAIMMAHAHPDARIEALTAVSGNVDLGHTAENCKRILDVLGADIPIYPGCAQALVYPAGTAAYVHGEDGLGDCGFPPSARALESEHAASAIVRMANESPGELTLVAIGPLTNLAVALHLDPDLPAKFKKLVVMGGAIDARGNTENLSAEFNIHTDPEAAHVVFESWLQLTLVSWETTLRHGIPFKNVERWKALDNPRARFFSAISDKVLVFLKEVLGRDVFYGADGLAMAVALEPGIVRRAERHNVTVETGGRYTRGQTTVDWYDRGTRTANTDVVIEVDDERFIELMALAVE